MIAVQAALSGALIGGLYALMAAGLSVTWGVLRVINLAHFGLILVGAYLTYQLTTTWGLDPILTLLVTAPALFVVGAALQWAYDRLDIAEFNSLLVSFGLLIIVIQAATRIWSADFLQMRRPTTRTPPAPCTSAGSPCRPPRLVAFAFALLLIGGAHLVLQRTFAGRGLRAFAQDRTVAAAFGIDHRRLGLVVGGLAGASAAVAGMVFALSNTLTPAQRTSGSASSSRSSSSAGSATSLGTLVAGIGVGAFSAIVSVVWAPATRRSCCSSPSSWRWCCGRRACSRGGWSYERPEGTITLVGVAWCSRCWDTSTRPSASRRTCSCWAPRCCSGSPRPPAGTSCPASPATSASARPPMSASARTRWRC